MGENDMIKDAARRVLNLFDCVNDEDWPEIGVLCTRTMLASIRVHDSMENVNITGNVDDEGRDALLHLKRMLDEETSSP